MEWEQGPQQYLFLTCQVESVLITRWVYYTIPFLDFSLETIKESGCA